MLTYRSLIMQVMSLKVSVIMSLVMSCAVWSVSGNYKRFFRLMLRNSTILYAGAHILLITGHTGLLTSCIFILVFSVGAVGFICNRHLVIQGVSGVIVNILGGGSMDYSE
jgi:hypothetical protein